MATSAPSPIADPPALQNARSLAKLLDAAVAVPGTRFRVGLDPLLGLVPGFGDLAGVVLSISILFSAARLGVPRASLLRMGANIGLEALVGTVPLLGDLFDAGWRANTRNVRLIEEHVADPTRAARSGSRWVWSLALGIGAILVLLVLAAAWLVLSALGAVGFF